MPDTNIAPVPIASLDVVIPCRNAAVTLPRQLDALVAQEWDGRWRVVIADNGSTDATRAVVAQYTDRLPVRVVDASDRRGQAHARNVGARAADGNALLFIDADDEIAPGYVAAMAAALERHEFVSAAFESRSLNEGWVAESRVAYQDVGLNNGLGFLPFAGGGGLGVRREIFERVGGFDDAYWRSGEDIDFCWRVQLAGSELHFVPGATVRIAWRRQLRQLYRQGRHYGRGEPYLYRKYRHAGMPASSLWTGLGEWRLLLRRLRRVRGKGDAARWVRTLGRRVGRVQGSIRHRVVYL